MPTVNKIVRARDLPRDWGKAFSDPDQPVRVTISDIDPALDKATSLATVMDLISDRAEARGLTPETADDIIHER